MKMQILILLALAGVIAGSFTVARAQTASFAGVVPFSTPAGRLGFFDQNSGRIYIYDNEVKTCLFQGRVTELGKDISQEAAVTGKKIPVRKSLEPIRIDRGQDVKGH